MGLRLRLKAGYGLGGFSGPALTIALAMKAATATRMTIGTKYAAS